MGHVVSVVELGKLVLHRYGPQNVSRPLIQNTQNDPHIRRALQDISKSSAAIRALIINFFCISALPIAKELHIPTHYFYTSGAAALAAFLYFPKLHEQTTKSFQDLTNTVFEIPGLKSPLKAIHMVQPMLDRDRPAYWDMLYFCSHLPKSNGIIVNTVEELEPASILKAIVQGLCVSDGPTPPVYHIGPLIDEEKESGNATAEGEEDCLRGSFPLIQLKEVAKGLERSGKRFLWVVKKPPVDVKTKQVHGVDNDFDLEGLLPEGFLERTNDGQGGEVMGSAGSSVEEGIGGWVCDTLWLDLGARSSGFRGTIDCMATVCGAAHEQKCSGERHGNSVKGGREREEDGFVSGEELERKVRELMELERGKALRERSKKTGEMALDKHNLRRDWFVD
ncbi:unnamed protein product [Malus baccata var. baccata]